MSTRPRWRRSPDLAAGLTEGLHGRVEENGRREGWQKLPAVVDYGHTEKPMPTRNINLTEHFSAFLDRQILLGRYGNASEIVREARLKALRQAAKQGFDQIDQGEGIRLQGKAGLAQFFNEIDSELLAQNARNGG